MRIRIRAFGSFRRYLGREMVVEIAEGSSVEDLLRELPEEARRLALDDFGSIREDVNLLKGGQNVELLGGLGLMLQDGDDLSILSAAVGG